MKQLFLLLSYFFANLYMAGAQNALPNTDIFICDVALKDGKYSFTNLKNITNRDGYDNQPSFINNHTILYTSIREDKQADIYKYDLETGKTTQLTNTPESEFSPALMPDGKYISVVRIEKDSTQRLWKFPVNNASDFSLVFPQIKKLAGCGWINDSVAAVSVLGNPYTVFISHLNNNYSRKIDTYTGSNVQKITDSTFAYENKNDSDWKGIWVANYNKMFNTRTWEIGLKMSLPKNCEDFIYGPDCAFWINESTKLMRYDPAVDKGWKLIHDFNGTPVENFYRIAFSPDGTKLALVKYVGQKPKSSNKHSTW